jgi:hypothetical protein
VSGSRPELALELVLDPAPRVLVGPSQVIEHGGVPALDLTPPDAEQRRELVVVEAAAEAQLEEGPVGGVELAQRRGESGIVGHVSGDGFAGRTGAGPRMSVRLRIG